MARASRICSCRGCAAHAAGCPAVTALRRCTSCSSTAETARGTKQQRGYDKAHDRLRRRWKVIVDRGMTACARCHELINPLVDEWHLDHTDDRTGYLGPSHAACNTSAGGRAGHRQSPRGGGG